MPLRSTGDLKRKHLLKRIDDLERQLARKTDLHDRDGRELMKLKEAYDAMKADYASACDELATHDLIAANREATRDVNEEAIRRIKTLWGLSKPVDPMDVLAIAQAASGFHPMHTESWCGWPEIHDAATEEPSA